jgi:hypothetical protein
VAAARSEPLSDRSSRPYSTPSTTATHAHPQSTPTMADRSPARRAAAHWAASIVSVIASHAKRRYGSKRQAWSWFTSRPMIARASAMAKSSPTSAPTTTGSAGERSHGSPVMASPSSASSPTTDRPTSRMVSGCSAAPSQSATSPSSQEDRAQQSDTFLDTAFPTRRVSRVSDRRSSC